MDQDCGALADGYGEPIITRNLTTPKLERGFLAVDGQRFEVARTSPEPRRKTTLVFLHEGLGCLSLWRDFPAKLAGAVNCRAFVFSRLGYGASDPCPLPRPIEFMHHEGLRVLPQVLKRAGIHDYLLVGHSDGGSIALIHAGSPDAKGLRGVITEAAHVFCESLTVRAIRRARTRYLRGELRRKLTTYHRANTQCAFWGWNDVWLHPDFRHWNIEAYLPKIQVPVLAIQGENDNYGTGAQLEAIGQQAGKGAETLMLPACGHTPHRDRETQTLTVMGDFIRRLVDVTGA